MARVTRSRSGASRALVGYGAGMDAGLRRSHRTMLLVAMAAVCGLLAMHGFEAAFVHVDHAGSGGHIESANISLAEHHVHHGGCNLENPDAPAFEPPLECVSAWSIDATSAATSADSGGLWSFANRAVLTAFSILRL